MGGRGSPGTAAGRAGLRQGRRRLEAGDQKRWRVWRKGGEAGGVAGIVPASGLSSWALTPQGTELGCLRGV